MHPPRPCATSCTIIPISLLHLILHLLLLHSVPHSTTLLSFLQHMEPMRSRVRKNCSQKKEEARLQRAPALKKVANHYHPYDVCLSIVCLHASYWGRLLCLISWVMHNYNTYYGISDDESEDTGDSSISFCIEADNLNYQRAFSYLRQAHCDMSWEDEVVPL